MKMPAIATDRSRREEFKDKVEVVMAVFVLTGFAWKKYQARHNPQENTHEEVA